MKPGGKKLKTIKFPKRIIALLCGAVLCLGGLATAFAAEDDPFIGESDPVIVTDSPIYTDPPIVTDPPIETIPIPPVTLFGSIVGSTIGLTSNP